MQTDELCDTAEFDHPDYLDYVERQNVRGRAQWHDLKFLVRKVTTAELRSIYVRQCDWGNDNGWLIEFSNESYIDHDFYIAELKRHLFGVVRLGQRVCWIKAVA